MMKIGADGVAGDQRSSGTGLIRKHSFFACVWRAVPKVSFNDPHYDYDSLLVSQHWNHIIAVWFDRDIINLYLLIQFLLRFWKQLDKVEIECPITMYTQKYWFSAFRRNNASGLVQNAYLKTIGPTYVYICLRNLAQREVVNKHKRARPSRHPTNKETWL